MAWGERKIYERGFWNRAVNGRINETAVLDVKEGEEVSDGIIEDDDEGKNGSHHTSDQDSIGWIRVLRSGARITVYVDGFVCTQQLNGKRIWTVGERPAENFRVSNMYWQILNLLTSREHLFVCSGEWRVVRRHNDTPQWTRVVITFNEQLGECGTHWLESSSLYVS